MTQNDRFESFIDHLPIGVFRLDLARGRLYANQRLADFAGLPAGWSNFDHLSGNRVVQPALSALQQAAANVVESGEVAEIELSLESRRGGRREIRFRLALEPGESGRATYVVGVANDVTKSKRLEAALRESEDRFKAFMDHTPNIAWIKDEDGRYVFANNAYEWRHGIAEKDWRGKTDFDLWPAEFALACRKEEEAVLESGRPREVIGPTPALRGETRDWHLLRFPFHDSTGRRYIGGIGADITDRRKLERALRDNEEKLKGLMDNSPVIVWMKDAEGRYVYLSHSYEQRFGVRLDDWRGRTDFEFWPREDAERFRQTDRDVLSGWRTIETTEKARDREGREGSWWVFKFPFQNAAGERFVGGVGVDITERRRVEEEMRLQSLLDDLTGLYNRRGFLPLAEQEIRKARGSRTRCMLFFLDLDGLKQINDAHGHEVGDEALIGAGELLRVSFRNSDLIGRLGGDEFVILATNCANPDTLRARLQLCLDEHNRVNQTPYRLSFSVGVVEVDPNGSEGLEQVLARADEMMYASKRRKVS